MRTARQRCGPCTPRAPLPARRWHHSRPKLASHGARPASAWRASGVAWPIDGSRRPLVLVHWPTRLPKRRESFSFFVFVFFRHFSLSTAPEPRGAIGVLSTKRKFFGISPTALLRTIIRLARGNRLVGPSRRRDREVLPASLRRQYPGRPPRHAQRWRRRGRWRCSGAGCGRCRLRVPRPVPVRRNPPEPEPEPQLGRVWQERRRRSAHERRAPRLGTRAHSRPG